MQGLKRMLLGVKPSTQLFVPLSEAALMSNAANNLKFIPTMILDKIPFFEKESVREIAFIRKYSISYIEPIKQSKIVNNSFFISGIKAQNIGLSHLILNYFSRSNYLPVIPKNILSKEKFLALGLNQSLCNKDLLHFKCFRENEFLNTSNAFFKIKNGSKILYFQKKPIEEGGVLNKPSEQNFQKEKPVNGNGGPEDPDGGNGGSGPEGPDGNREPEGKLEKYFYRILVGAGTILLGYILKKKYDEITRDRKINKEKIRIIESLLPKKYKKQDTIPRIIGELINIDENYIDIDMTENNSKIKATYQNIFDKRNGQVPKKVLILGEPGLGKTIFCQKIAYEWAKKKFYNDKFETVFLIRLKEVYKNGFEKGRRYEIPEIIRQLSNIEKKKYTNEAIESLLDEEKVLIIVDGYDELKWLDGRSKYMVDRLINSNIHLILTSRPDKPPFTESFRSQSILQLEISGFSHNNKAEYIRNIFRDNDETRRKGEDLISHLNENRSIRDLCNRPILVDMMCSIWAENAQKIKENEDFKKYKIYEFMTELLYEKFCEDKDIEESKFTFGEKCEDFFCKVGFNMISRSNNTITERETKKIISTCLHNMKKRDKKKKEDVIEHIGLLKKISKAEKKYKFVHLSFLEYFSAKRLYRNFSDPSKDLNSGVFSSLHLSKQPEVISFLADMISCDDNTQKTEKLLDLLGSIDNEREEIIIPKVQSNAVLVLDKMNALFTDKSRRLSRSEITNRKKSVVATYKLIFDYKINNPIKNDDFLYPSLLSYLYNIIENPVFTNDEKIEYFKNLNAYNLYEMRGFRKVFEEINKKRTSGLKSEDLGDLMLYKSWAECNLGNNVGAEHAALEAKKYYKRSKIDENDHRRLFLNSSLILAYNKMNKPEQIKKLVEANKMLKNLVNYKIRANTKKQMKEGQKRGAAIFLACYGRYLEDIEKNYQGAITLYERAIKIRTDLKSDQYYVLTCKNHIGRTLIKMEKYEEALRKLTEVRKSRENIDPYHIDLATTYECLAKVFVSAKNNEDRTLNLSSSEMFEKAKENLTKAEKIKSSYHSLNSTYIGYLQRLLAEVHYIWGEDDDNVDKLKIAEEKIDSAIEIAKATVKDSPKDLKRYQALKDIISKAIQEMEEKEKKES